MRQKQTKLCARFRGPSPTGRERELMLQRKIWPTPTEPAGRKRALPSIPARQPIPATRPVRVDPLIRSRPSFRTSRTSPAGPAQAAVRIFAIALTIWDTRSPRTGGIAPKKPLTLESSDRSAKVSKARSGTATTLAGRLVVLLHERQQHLGAIAHRGAAAGVDIRDRSAMLEQRAQDIPTLGVLLYRG